MCLFTEGLNKLHSNFFIFVRRKNGKGFPVFCYYNSVFRTKTKIYALLKIRVCYNITEKYVIMTTKSHQQLLTMNNWKTFSCNRSSNICYFTLHNLVNMTTCDILIKLCFYSVNGITYGLKSEKSEILWKSLWYFHLIVSDKSFRVFVVYLIVQLCSRMRF